MNDAPHTTGRDRVVSLSVGQSRWRFVCDEASAESMAREVFRMADEPGSGLDWFAAAVVAHELLGAGWVKTLRAKGRNE